MKAECIDARTGRSLEIYQRGEDDSRLPRGKGRVGRSEPEYIFKEEEMIVDDDAAKDR